MKSGLRLRPDSGDNPHDVIIWLTQYLQRPANITIEGAASLPAGIKPVWDTLADAFRRAVREHPDQIRLHEVE